MRYERRNGAGGHHRNPGTATVSEGSSCGTLGGSQGRVSPGAFGNNGGSTGGGGGGGGYIRSQFRSRPRPRPHFSIPRRQLRRPLTFAFSSKLLGQLVGQLQMLINAAQKQGVVIKPETLALLSSLSAIYPPLRRKKRPRRTAIASMEIFSSVRWERG